MYQMASFNEVHIKYMTISLIITLLLLIVAIPFNKKKYGKFFGYTILILKAMDIFYRVFFEGYRPIVLALPFHMCNIAVILAGIYLINANKYLYGIIYTWMFGAIIVMFEPSNFTFNTQIYGVLFFLTHTTIIAAVIYGKIYYKAKMSFNSYIVSMIVFLVSALNAYIFNKIFGTNFLFLNDYVLPVLSRFFSIRLYSILYVLANLLGITFMYKLSKIRK